MRHDIHLLNITFFEITIENFESTKQLNLCENVIFTDRTIDLNHIRAILHSKYMYFSSFAFPTPRACARGESTSKESSRTVLPHRRSFASSAFTHACAHTKLFKYLGRREWPFFSLTPARVADYTLVRLLDIFFSRVRAPFVARRAARVVFKSARAAAYGKVYACLFDNEDICERYKRGSFARFCIADCRRGYGMRLFLGSVCMFFIVFFFVVGGRDIFKIYTCVCCRNYDFCSFILKFHLDDTILLVLIDSPETKRKFHRY